MENEIRVGIGGAAGDGGASTGDNLALSCARQGLHVYVYTSFQSLIRGGHSWVRLRISAQKPQNVGDQVQCMIALNQDAMDRHLQELPPGGLCVYNGDKVKPGKAPAGVQLCPLPVFELVGRDALPIMQNTAALGALSRLIGLDFSALSSVFEFTFKKKPQVVKANIDAARAGYDFAGKTYQPFPARCPAPARSWPWWRKQRHRPGSGQRRMQNLLRLPHEPSHRNPALDGGAWKRPGGLRAAGGRMKSPLPIWPLARATWASGPCARLRGGDSP